MHKIIHVTDTHVVPEGQTFIGLKPVRRLELAIDSINEKHSNAEMVVFAGDLVEYGDVESYKTFKRHADRLTVPYTIMMGNHDLQSEMQRVFPDVPVDEYGFIQYTMQRDFGTFIMCDTQSGLFLDGPHGRYCEKRCAWLSQQLEQASGDVYIFMHHPPMNIGTGIDGMKMVDEKPLLDVLTPHRDKIKYLFFGHVHRCVTGVWHGFPYSIMRSTNQQVDLTLRGEDDGWAINFEDPAYGVILFDAGNVIYHTYSYAESSPRLEQYDFHLPREEKERQFVEQLKDYNNWKDY